MPWFIRMLIYIFPAILLAYSYVGWRVAQSISDLAIIPARQLRFIVPAVILFCNLLPMVTLVFFFQNRLSSLFLYQPQLTVYDLFLTYPFWLGLIIVIETLPYLILIDVFGFISKQLNIANSTVLKEPLAIIRLALVFLFLIYVPIRAYSDTQKVRIQDYTVEIAQLPDALEGLSLGLVADVQVDRYTSSSKMQRIKSILKNSDDDLLFFAGDLVTRGQEFIPAGLQLLCNAPEGVPRFACPGDHDLWSNPNRIQIGLTNCGWQFLENQHRLISVRGKRILITGIIYTYSQRPRLSDLKKLFGTAPEADLKILLVHQPAESVIQLAESYGYHLLLAGHTHGGQLVFRPFGFSLTPSQLENKVYAGHALYKELHVVVSRGIGLTFAPLRYQAPAEYSRIILHKKSR